MGLSVGVVTIEYLAEPQAPVSDFLKDLAMNPALGLDGEHWGGGWGENTFLEFELSALMERANGWCSEKGVSVSGRAVLIAWVSRLPWQDSYVMLHLGV